MHFVRIARRAESNKYTSAMESRPISLSSFYLIYEIHVGRLILGGNQVKVRKHAGTIFETSDDGVNIHGGQLPVWHTCDGTNDIL